jgi:hypothetical protein
MALKTDPVNLRILVSKFKLLKLKAEYLMRRHRVAKKDYPQYGRELTLSLDELEKEVLGHLDELGREGLILLQVRGLLTIVKERLKDKAVDYRWLKREFLDKARAIKDRHPSLKIPQLESRLALFEDEVNTYIVKSIKHLVTFLRCEVSDNPDFVESFKFWEVLQGISRQIDRKPINKGDLRRHKSR